MIPRLHWYAYLGRTHSCAALHHHAHYRASGAHSKGRVRSASCAHIAELSLLVLSKDHRKPAACTRRHGKQGTEVQLSSVTQLLQWFLCSRINSQADTEGNSAPNISTVTSRQGWCQCSDARPDRESNTGLQRHKLLF